MIALKDTESFPTLPLRLLDREKGYAQSVKENGKWGDLLMKRATYENITSN